MQVLYAFSVVGKPSMQSVNWKGSGHRLTGQQWHACQAPDFVDEVSLERRNEMANAAAPYLPWQCLNLRPLPHGHGSFRPALANAFCNCASSAARTNITTSGARLRRNKSAMMRIGLSTCVKNAL